MHPETEFCFDFIRHGQSTAQLRPDLIGGRTPEAGLTDLGFLQAAKLGERLWAEGVTYDAVFISNLKRARQTALTVCQHVSFDTRSIIVVPALTELDQGVWEGRARLEVMDYEALVRINFQAPWFAPPGGESQQMAQRRIAAWLEEEVLRNETYRQAGHSWRLGVFAHGTVLKCLFQAIMGFESNFIGRGLYLENCSLSRFRFNRRGWFVDSLNDVGHLIGLRSREESY